jgi:hypothetical protein
VFPRRVEFQTFTWPLFFLDSLSTNTCDSESLLSYREWPLNNGKLSVGEEVKRVSLARLNVLVFLMSVCYYKYIMVKVKFSPLQALKALRVVRG